MSTFEAFALLIGGGPTVARDAGGGHGEPSSPAGPSRKAPPGGRAAPEKAPADLGIFWVNGVNGGINGVNGGADGVNGGINGRPPGATSKTASDLIRERDQASVSWRIQIFTGARPRPTHRMARCRACYESGGTCVGR
jgi:hypothetical protein